MKICNYCGSEQHSSSVCQQSTQPGKKRLGVETDDFGHQQFTSLDKPRKFWLCWVESNSAPVKKHLTLLDAAVEASRLSMLPGNEGTEVYILEAKSFYVTSWAKADNQLCGIMKAVRHGQLS